MKQIIVALTGPSGIGKTTLGDLLVQRNNFIYPTHTTTRSIRSDDRPGFYRYLSHDEFDFFVQNNDFLYWSGDGEIVSSIYGNYYGMLKDDYHVVEHNERIIINISYKDIDSISSLIKQGYNIKVFNLKYFDLEHNMEKRLLCSERNHTKQDIRNRIKCAIEYERDFAKKLEMSGVTSIYSDVLNVEETYDAVVRKLIMKGE